MITIKKNPEIKLDIPVFHCDNNAVGEHLNNHPLTQFLNCYGFLCVIGRPGSGKTSMSVSLITQKEPKIYKKTHHHILVVMPQNSINSLKKNPFKQLPEENFYEELNDATVQSIYDRVNEYSAENEKTLLFLDDITADLKRSKIVIDVLKKLIFNRRHLKLNVIITAQSYVNIPLDVRKCISSLILFKPPKKEMEIVFNELIESKKDLFLDVMKIVFDEKHNFLFVNVPTQKMFKNFDELIIRDDDSDIEVEKNISK
jgi:ATP:corrinoid adenosyltransferase